MKKIIIYEDLNRINFYSSLFLIPFYKKIYFRDASYAKKNFFFKKNINKIFFQIGLKNLSGSYLNKSYQLKKFLIRKYINNNFKINFFKNGWNVFDSLIVLISLIPIPNNSSYLLLRLLRIFRVLRIISVVPELKKIIEALIDSIKRVFYVSLLLFIILYVYATIGSILFSEDMPSRWNDVGISLITLFQVLTLSSWEQVMLPLQEIYWWAWMYFFSFIIICAITMLNLLIAVLVDVVINQKKL